MEKAERKIALPKSIFTETLILHEKRIVMELHKKIKETRIQEICDKYIGESVKDNKPISKKDVASLSCAELVVLYYNTEWLIERSNGDGINTGLENQILLMDLIKERVKESTLYVIYTDATNMPFLTENKSILVYTEKRFADIVACSFSVEYFKESIRFMALEVSENKENYWNKLRAAGINTISVDGTKFTIEIDDIVKDKEKYENIEFCRFLIQYAQAIRLGIHRDKISIFQDAIMSKLKKNPKMIHGSIISKGENKFLSLYVNTSATNETMNIAKLKTENFYEIGEEIFDNKNITGIVLNPEREHIVVPREKILEVFAHLNVKVKSNAAKLSEEEQIKRTIVQCNKCGKLWQVEKLDSSGVCPVCLKEKHAERNNKISITATKTPSERWVRCKKCGIEWPPAKLNNDGLCPNCVYKAQNTTPPITKHATSSTVGTQITNTVNRANLNRTSNRPQIVNKPPQEKNYALWCMICGFISLVWFFVSIITFDNASKAIKQAKAKGEAVSGKVWIGVATSVVSILFFIFFMFLPMVLD